MLRYPLLFLALALGASNAAADPRTDCFNKNGAAAIQACTLSIQRNPKDTVSYINRAFEYLESGQLDRSVADYSRAIELEPGRGDALQGRAWAYLKTGKLDLALADAERSLQLSPDDARALDTRGHVNEALGRNEAAIADYRRALSLEPRMQGSKEGLKRLNRSP